MRVSSASWARRAVAVSGVRRDVGAPLVIGAAGGPASVMGEPKQRSVHAVGDVGVLAEVVGERPAGEGHDGMVGHGPASRPIPRDSSVLAATSSPLVDEAQEQVLGTDEVVVEQTGFLLGQH